MAFSRDIVKRGSLLGHVVFFLWNLQIGLIATLCVFLLLPTCTIAQANGSRGLKSAPNFDVFQKGEELVYEVSYLTIKLGRIISRVVAIDTTRKGINIKMDCLIRTYKGIPFVTLNTIFQSTVNDSLASISFSTKEYFKDTTFKYIHYSFPKKKNVVWISERLGNQAIPENYDTLSLENKSWQDGLSLLFYARAHALQKYHDKVPVLMYRTKATTTINFRTAREGIDLDAVRYPVDAIKLEGETGFTGIFGLTGGFEGWFSNDVAAIPLYAKMHVLIGSIRLELIHWKRKNWIPPKSIG